MLEQAFVLVGPGDGGFGDIASLSAAARLLAPRVAVLVRGTAGPDVLAAALAGLCEQAVLLGDGARHAEAAELARLLGPVLPQGAVLLMSHDSAGMDLGPGLAALLHKPFLSGISGLEFAADGAFLATRPEYGGQIEAQYALDLADGAVLTLIPGAIQGDPAPAEAGLRVVQAPAPAGAEACGRRHVRTLDAPMSGVDIARAERLLCVGRGIGEEENLCLAREAARAMRAELCCSRPVADAGWLEKERQVGISGRSVCPRVYLACGVSGAFQHVAGIGGAAFVIAVNSNAKAPVFQVADVGVVADVAEFLPRLAEALGAPGGSQPSG